MKRISGDQALVPYTNGIDSFSQRAGSDIGMVYGDGVGETPCPGIQLLIFVRNQNYICKIIQLNKILSNEE